MNGHKTVEENRRLWDSLGWIQGRQNMPIVAANCRHSPQATGNSYLFFLQIEILFIYYGARQQVLAHTQRKFRLKRYPNVLTVVVFSV